MSYLTGTSTSPTALLKAFRDFLVTAGWTLDQDTVMGTGWLVAVSKGSKHIALKSFINDTDPYTGNGGGAPGSGIGITAYSGTYVVPGTPANWWNQAGAPYLYNQNPNVNVLTAVMVLPAATIPNFWMFADASGDNCALVGFRASGIYTYLYFGDMVKTQAWTGGVYFGASSAQTQASLPASSGNGSAPQPPGGFLNAAASSFLRADVDSWTNKWVSLTTDRAPTSIFNTGKAMFSSTFGVAGFVGQTLEQISYGTLRLNAKSSLTSGLIMLPTHWLVERDFGGNIWGGGWSLAGTIPGIFQTTTDGFVPGATYTISTDQYSVFPSFAIRKYP